MELRHLRYFAAVADELHFGRAAGRLAISQPPLSLAIRQLEDELGAKLFERDSKRVALTPAGEAFLDDVRHLLAQSGEAAEHARRVAGGSTGRLRVGFSGSMLYRGLPEAVAAYRSAWPGVVLTLVELNSAEQIDALAHDRLEAGFVHVPQVPDGLDGLLVADEPFVACLPEGHALARSSRLDLRELAADPFVLFARSASPLYYEQVIALCIAAGFRPQVQFEARHWLSVVALVAEGMGVAVVPAAIGASGMHGVRFATLRPSRIQSTSWCVWNPRRRSPARQAFVELWRAAKRG
ncbi:MAG: LysR family transcriptional regulator [Proteobacteria bacterium]|nr:LysR family transcriptional regulator [Pseudomonadota bacterium]